MIVQLTPDQISSIWESVKHKLLDEPMPDPEYSSPIVLSALMDGKFQMWAAYDGDSVFSYAITYMFADRMTGLRYLSFLGMTIEKQVSLDKWKMSFEDLRRYAISEGCNRISGSTSSKVMAKIMKSLGGRIGYISVFDLDDTNFAPKPNKDEMKEVLI